MVMLASASTVQLSLQLCNEAVDHDDGSKPKGYSPDHVAEQHTLGAPVRTQSDERDCAEGGSPPVQKRGVLWTAERVTSRIAHEKRAKKYEQRRQPAAEKDDERCSLSAGIEELDEHRRSNREEKPGGRR